MVVIAPHLGSCAKWPVLHEHFVPNSHPPPQRPTDERGDVGNRRVDHLLFPTRPNTQLLGRDDIATATAPTNSKPTHRTREREGTKTDPELRARERAQRGRQDDLWESDLQFVPPPATTRQPRGLRLQLVPRANQAPHHPQSRRSSSTPSPSSPRTGSWRAVCPPLPGTCKHLPNPS